MGIEIVASTKLFSNSINRPDKKNKRRRQVGFALSCVSVNILEVLDYQYSNRKITVFFSFVTNIKIKTKSYPSSDPHPQILSTPTQPIKSSLLLFSMERQTQVFRGCTFLVYLPLTTIS